MTSQEIANTLVVIAKDLNVFIRAANLRNLTVDSNMGPLTGGLLVSVSDYVPALAASAIEGKDFDEIQLRAKSLIDSGFKAPDIAGLEILDDETAKQTIAETLASMETTKEVAPDNIEGVPTEGV